MAITYPLALPTTIGFASISLRAEQAISISSSPFSFKQQVIAHSGERWSATVSLPPLRREFIEDWAGFLVSLRGQYGTFLLNDPANSEPRGTATSATVSGSAGDRSVSVTMTGTLLRGDYIQINTGANARLHKVVADRTGSGTMEIWPALRATPSSTKITGGPAGVFRLADNVTQWDIDSASAYGLSFNCVEVIT